MNTEKRPSRGGASRSSHGGTKLNFKKPGKRHNYSKTKKVRTNGRKDTSTSRSTTTSSEGFSRPSKPANSSNSRPNSSRGGFSSRGSSGGSRGGSRGGGFNRGSNRGGSRGGSSRGGGSRGGGRKMPTFDPSQFINRNPVAVKEEVYVPKHQFDGFGLDARLVHTLTKMGIKTPSPIQDQVIPEILKGHDVVGLAETGTGKTAAFLLPILEQTFKNDRKQTLIMAPTRELALQINEELRKLAGSSKIFSTVCVGGVNIQPQIKGLRRKNHFIIGTPGRLLDLIRQKHFNPKFVTTVVLDEADRMLDMGFIGDMRAILGATAKDRETYFFSATMDSNAEKLVNDFLNNPVTISVKKKDVTNSIEQDIIEHGHHDKFETLTELLRSVEFSRVIIFGAMKHSVKRLAQELNEQGIKSESIHGNKTHGQRQNALRAFKENKVRVLVATDVAARGIHVDNVSHVINYDLPGTFEDYVHRIGRTGRGSKRGKALTFVQKKSVKDRV